MERKGGTHLTHLTYLTHSTYLDLLVRLGHRHGSATCLRLWFARNRSPRVRIVPRTGRLKVPPQPQKLEQTPYCPKHRAPVSGKPT